MGVFKRVMRYFGFDFLFSLFSIFVAYVAIVHYSISTFDEGSLVLGAFIGIFLFCFSSGLFGVYRYLTTKSLDQEA